MIIDLICGLMLLLGFWIGYQRGIIQLLFNLISYTFGLVLAFKMSGSTSAVLQNLFNSTNPLMFFAGFLVNLGIVMILIRFAATTLEGIFSVARMAFINQILGGVMYGGFFVLIFSVLVWFGEQTLVINDEAKRGSQTITILEKMPGQTKNILISMQPIFAEIWQTSVMWMEKVKNNTKVNPQKTKIYDIEENKPSNQSTSRGIEDFPEDLITKPKTYPQTPKDYGTGIEND